MGSVAKRTGYQTSLAGLIGALVLCLLFIVAYIGMRAFSRDELEVQAESFDPVPVVRQFQAEGLQVLYPESVPTGWRATSLDNVPNKYPVFGMGFVTRTDSDATFVGYKWADLSASATARRAMGEDVAEGESVTLDTPEFGTEWTEWSHGADTGVSTEYPAEGRTLLVWGTVTRQEMVDFINSLTTDTLPGVTPSATPTVSPTASS